MLDRNCLIDPVMFGFASFELRVSLGAKRCGDVGHQDLGVDLLLDGAGQLPSEAFEVQATFEGLECLLDAPAGMVERCKLGSWVGDCIEQRCDQDLDVAGGQDHPHQTQTQHGRRLCLACGLAKFG